jgi:ABC-2 type transport system ATP-binding protein
LIEVEGLTRNSHGRPAVVDVSFTVARGQVLGLVGPDGSGKSTILRVLAGLLSPTSGRVTVAGYDVRTRSREARRRVGYLPAGTPLYDEIRVEPYLRTMCRLRGVAPGLRRARIDGALERCGLGDHRREVIGRLPGGLRQRVGFAQAIVHDPDALVLDEPGAHELIVELGRGRAVVLSGRASSEMSGVCGRVLFLDAGRVVADEAPAGPGARHVLEVLVVVRGDAAAAERNVRGLAGVSALTLDELGDGTHRLTVKGEGEDLQDAIARVLVEHGIGLKELSTRQPSSDEAP